jgi:NAD-dependent SIR2 family protein deacetylase
LEKHTKTFWFINLHSIKEKGDFMMSIKCAKCQCEIDDYKSMIQIIEDAGYTTTYCAKCGEEVKKRIAQRDKSIK